MYSIILINSDTMDVMQCAVMKPKSRSRCMLSASEISVARKGLTANNYCTWDVNEGLSM